MKSYPESWGTDTDKKFSPFDESLINQIIDGVLKYNQKIKFNKKRHDTDIPGGDFSQRLVFVFKKGEEDFYFEFLKISEHNKENFIDKICLPEWISFPLVNNPDFKAQVIFT